MYLYFLSPRTDKYPIKEHALEIMREGEDAVTLKCSAQAEAQICLESDQITLAMDQLEAICPRIPVHVMFGEYNDLMYVSPALP